VDRGPSLRRVRDDPAQMSGRKKAVITMPPGGAFCPRASWTISSPTSRRSRTSIHRRRAVARAMGSDVAIKYGCSTATAPRDAAPRRIPARSSGYIPSWDGDDFATSSMTTVRSAHGSWTAPLSASRRPDRDLLPGAAADPHARLSRTCRDAEVDRLIDYIRWLRAERPHPAADVRSRDRWRRTRAAGDGS